MPRSARWWRCRQDPLRTARAASPSPITTSPSSTSAPSTKRSSTTSRDYGPQVNERTVGLQSGSGVRKQPGTFYTPQPIADYLVRRTLEPLVRDATPDRILRLRIVDPAMGSGAFLVAACRYLAGVY